MSDFYREKMVKSRRSRPCMECGDMIPVGAVYHYAVAKDRQEPFFAGHTCAPCNALRVLLKAGWFFGDLWSDIVDCGYYELLEDDSPTALQSLARLSMQVGEAAMNKLVEQHQKWLVNEYIQ